MRWGGYRLRRTAQSAGKAMLFFCDLKAALGMQRVALALLAAHRSAGGRRVVGEDRGLGAASYCRVRVLFQELLQRAVLLCVIPAREPPLEFATPCLPLSFRRWCSASTASFSASSAAFLSWWVSSFSAVLVALS